MYGWDGYEQVIEQQIKLGSFLRTQLQQDGWEIYNHTQLPIVCFGRKHFKEDSEAAIQFSKRILDSENAWVSVYNINEINTMRTCITNYITDKKNIRILLKILNETESQIKR